MNRYLLTLISLLLFSTCGKYTWDYPDIPTKPISVTTISQKKLTIGAGKPSEIIHFWAYNHPLSRQSLTYMNQLAREAKDENIRFVVVCLNWAGTESEVADYLKNNKFGFEVVFDTDSRIESQFKVTSVPQTLIIKDNTVTHRLMGLREDIDYPSDIVKKARD